MEDRAHADILPGFLLERYRVEEVISEQACQAVIRAFDTRTKRMVAVNALKLERAAPPPDEYRMYKEYMHREVDAAARIGFHSHTVAVLDFVGDEDNTRYLVLEYLTGGTLAAALAQGPLPAATTFRIAADVADGLHAAHEAGVVHCDIRPENLFLTQTGRAKVGNFGNAQIEGESKHTAAMIVSRGSPLYLSPEQENFLRPTTDQYSLGLVLFEMLTGEVYKQLADEDIAALMERQPTSIARIVRRMLAVQPEERFAAMSDVATSITRLLDDQQGFMGAQSRSPVRDLATDRPQQSERDLVQETEGAEATAESRGEQTDRLTQVWNSCEHPTTRPEVPVSESSTAEVRPTAQATASDGSSHSLLDLPDPSDVVRKGPAIARRHPILRFLGLLTVAIYLVVAVACLLFFLQHA